MLTPTCPHGISRKFPLQCLCPLEGKKRRWTLIFFFSPKQETRFQNDTALFTSGNTEVLLDENWLHELDRKSETTARFVWANPIGFLGHSLYPKLWSSFCSNFPIKSVQIFFFLILAYKIFFYPDGTLFKQYGSKKEEELKSMLIREVPLSLGPGKLYTG